MAAARRQFKVCLLGEGRVGKTSIILQYVENKFDGDQESTRDASFLQKIVAVGGQPATLNIWDTAGQERYHALTPLYYRDADGALLVYDITSASSFERVKHWVRELRKMMGKDIVLTIAGNKSDLEQLRNVKNEEAVAYASSVGASHHLVSAKSGGGLQDAFGDLVSKMFASGRRAGGGHGRKKSKLIIVDDEIDMGSRSGGCC